MKLYATVTSERATKGQGGNDKLEIKVTLNEHDNVLAEITVLPSGTIVIDEGEDCELVVNKYEKGIVNAICEDCGDGYEASEGCANCENKKGEKQKAECRHEIIKDAYGREYCQECGKYNVLS